MSSAREAALLALASLFFYSTAAILSRHFLREAGNVWRAGCINYLTIGFIMLPFSLTHFSLSLTFTALALIGLTVLLDSGANIAYFKAFSIDTLHSTMPIICLQPAFTILTTIILLPRSIHPLLALIAASLALSLAILSFRGSGKRSAIGLAFLGVAIGSFQAPIVKILLTTDHLTNTSTLIMLRAFGAGIIFLIFIRGELFKGPGLFPLILRGAIYTFSSVFYLTALAKGDIPSVSAIGWSAPLFTLPLSIIFLKEHPTLRQGAAALVSVIGVVLLVFIQ